MLFYSNFITAHFITVPFTDEETEAQRDDVTCLRTHSPKRAGQDLRPGLPQHIISACHVVETRVGPKERMDLD